MIVSLTVRLINNIKTDASERQSGGLIINILACTLQNLNVVSF